MGSTRGCFLWGFGRQVFFVVRHARQESQNSRIASFSGLQRRRCWPPIGRVSGVSRCLIPNHVSKLVQTLVEAVERNPEKRWKDRDFRELSVDVTTARHQFKKRFRMTFVQYARARRIGLVMKQIRAGEAVIDAQLSVAGISTSLKT